MKIRLPKVLARRRDITIRHRLWVTFVVINLLFAMNVGLYLWSNAHRAGTIQDYQEAVLAEKAITNVRQNLSNIQRQVTLLSQSMESATSASPEEMAEFKRHLQEVQQLTGDLLNLSKGDERRRVEALAESYAKLSASWLIFYESYGVNQKTAIMEMALHAEPLSQEILDSQVPALLEDEKRHVEQATTNFKNVGHFTDRITLFIFVISGIIAAINFFILYRYLTWALGELHLGVAVIGAGVLEHRIKLPNRDELGQLAETFNGMAENLGLAREELTSANAELGSRNKEIEAQRLVSDNLLLNILPEQIADELRKNETVEPKYFEDVTILFTDFVGFTLSTEQMAADDLVQMLNDYFTAFDQITSRYGIEKLKTIGDSYMCVSGMPVRSPSHPVDMVLAAFEMVHVVQQLSSRPGAPKWSVRVGIHKFAFDIWGEAVNYASRMESSGAANRVNLSERTHSRVKDFIACEYRGKVATKDKRELDMYFANGVLPELMDDPTQFPSPGFLRRYRTYFQKGPRAFPVFMAEQREAATEPVPVQFG